MTRPRSRAHSGQDEGSGGAGREDEPTARVEDLGEPEEAQPERLEVRHVDGLRELGGDRAQEVRLPRADLADQEGVPPACDVREEARALGLASDHRQLSCERSHGSTPGGRGQRSPA